MTWILSFAPKGQKHFLRSGNYLIIFSEDRECPYEVNYGNEPPPGGFLTLREATNYCHKHRDENVVNINKSIMRRDGRG